MKRETLQHPTQVRLPACLRARLSDTADRFGLPVSELIRRAIEWKLPSWEHSDTLVVQARKSSARRAVATALTIAASAALLLYSAHAPEAPDQAGIPAIIQPAFAGGSE